MSIPRVAALRAARDQLLREKAIAINALRAIAAFGDVGANLHLRSTGSYNRFDEPDAVKTARATLKKLGVTS